MNPGITPLGVALIEPAVEGMPWPLPRFESLLDPVSRAFSYSKRDGFPAFVFVVPFSDPALSLLVHSVTSLMGSLNSFRVPLLLLEDIIEEFVCMSYKEADFACIGICCD